MLNLDGAQPRGAAGALPELALLGERAQHALARPTAPAFSSADPRLASSELQRIYSRHRLLLQGPHRDFRMQLRLRELGSLVLSSLSFNTAVELAQDASEQFFLVTTQTRGHSEISSGREGGAGGAGFVVVDSATRDVVKRFSADSERLNVRIDVAAMTALCASLLGASLPRPLEFAPVLTPGGVAHGRWMCIAQLLLDHACAPPPARFAPLVYRRLEEAAMLTLLTEHQHNYSERLLAPAPPLAPRHVRAADEFMHSHAAQPLTLADIAGAVGVSVRTLGTGFQSWRGVTPMQRLREIRLAAAHDDLQRGDGDVGEVALRWGFGHLGRFAADYRQRFGELPSQTLRRGG